MLARIWGNWNTHTLLVGLSNDTSAVEIVWQALKGETQNYYMTHQFYSQVYTQKK